MQSIVSDALRPGLERDREALIRARSALDTIYGWLDGALSERPWATGDTFTLADAAAAPALL